MADSSNDKPKVADPPPEAHALHHGEEDTLNDGDVTDRLEETSKLDKTDEADSYVEVGDKPDPKQDFLDFLVYQASNEIVQRSRRVVYSIESGPRLHENLVERQDTKFQGFHWNRHFTWSNETSGPSTHRVTTAEGYTIRSGHEAERNFSVGAGFKGLSITIGGRQKKFNETETSPAVSATREFQAEPHVLTSLYQKQFNFLVEVWFWQRVPS